jgi:DNA-binding NtrC family response regulator
MRPEKRNSRKGSVLVVDDEEIMREVLETLLTAEGYRVDLAKTGEEGLEAYGRRAFDVVLLDVSMPGIGGLRALEEFLKMDVGCGDRDDYGLRDFRYRHCRLGTRCFWLHQKPFQNEQITATMPPASNGAAKRRTTHAAPRG